MKHITKFLLLAILVVFASCQNETLNEGASTEAEQQVAELELENEMLVSDGEIDETFVMDQDLDAEMPTGKISFSMSSRLSSEGVPSCTPDLEALELSLPDVVTATTTSKPGVDAYFSLDILDTDLAGTDLDAWCVDQDLSLNEGETLEFSVYSSYETLPDNEFEFPENFDKVNWILNQDLIGKTSVNGGAFTFGHIQYAIWLLVDDSVCRECRFLTSPVAEWGNNLEDNIALGEEIAQKARDNGEGFTPSCGEKVAVILNPAGKQAIIIGVDVPEKEEPCSDCEGKVTKLELEFDWTSVNKIDILQKKENTCYSSRVYCNRTAQPGEKISISGTNHDGTFGEYIYIYINNCYYTKIKTNCDTKIGPGYTRGVFNVISGESNHGGELCEYVKPDYNKCYRHWVCQYYNSCRYY